MVFYDQEKNDIMNDPWIQKKFNRTDRIDRKKKYIDSYLPELKSGYYKVFDIATGPGEFVECCNDLGNSAIGLDFDSGMFGRPIDSLYEKYNRIIHEERHLPVIYGDFAKIIFEGHEKLDEMKFNIINCEWAINFIFKEIFNYHPERKEYKNDGDWLIGDRFEIIFRAFFVWCKNHLAPNGIILLSALHATNEPEYSKEIIRIAMQENFILLKRDGNLIHKFKKM
jgi:hypothetical protein